MASDRQTGTRGIDAVEARALFDRAIVPMLLADDSRRYVDANAAACNALGLTRDEITARTIDDFSPSELRANLDDVWRRFLRNGTMTGVYRLALPTGRMLRMSY